MTSTDDGASDRRIAEWLTALSLLWRKLSRRREAMRPQGPAAAASNEVLANVFQRLPPRSIAACRAVCLRWSVLLSSPRFAAELADAGSSTCYAGLGCANAGRRGGAGPAAATWHAPPPLPKHQYMRFKKKRAYRRMIW